MEELKQRILKDGKVKEGNVLKVDSFLNHQMDIRLLDEIGKRVPPPVCRGEDQQDFDHRGIRHRHRGGGSAAL